MDTNSSYTHSKPCGIECKQKDIIEMIVDLESNTLSFNVNCKDHVVAHNIVMTYAKDDCVEFLGYCKL